MTEERISELRALCSEYERKKAIAEVAGLKDKAADIAADGVGRKALEALPELLARIRELEEERDVNEMRMKKAGDVFTDLLKAVHKITDKKEDEEGIPFKQVSALEPCHVVSNNNSTGST